MPWLATFKYDPSGALQVLTWHSDRAFVGFVHCKLLKLDHNSSEGLGRRRVLRASKMTCCCSSSLIGRALRRHLHVLPDLFVDGRRRRGVRVRARVRPRRSLVVCRSRTSVKPCFHGVILSTTNCVPGGSTTSSSPGIAL